MMKHLSSGWGSPKVMEVNIVCRCSYKVQRRSLRGDRCISIAFADERAAYFETTPTSVAMRRASSAAWSRLRVARVALRS
eukprot:4792774-Pleurochrysis_carterae.AAC.1